MHQRADLYVTILFQFWLNKINVSICPRSSLKYMKQSNVELSENSVFTTPIYVSEIWVSVCLSVLNKAKFNIQTFPLA